MGENHCMLPTGLVHVIVYGNGNGLEVPVSWGSHGVPVRGDSTGLQLGH
jgi:hypothetical protein